jgi:RHS repeat-associated protein
MQAANKRNRGRAGRAALACAGALVLALSALAGVDASEGTCGASRLGQPCPAAEMAGQGAPAPALNLGVGNPIHLVTGNKYQREIDLPGPAPRVGLEIVRHYNALDPRPSSLGRGWTLSYETRLHAHAGRGRVQIAQADGSRMDFRCEAPLPDAAVCRPIPPARGTLERDTDAWRWRWPDGRSLHFDAGGRLTRIADSQGGDVRIERDTAAGPTHGEILAAIDERGDALRFTYQTTAAGTRLSRIDAPSGAYVYSHDMPPARGTGAPGSARLIAAAHPAGWQRHYFYEASLQGGDPYRLTGIAWRRAGSDAQAVRTHSWAYDDAGRAILSVHGAPDATRDRVQLSYIATPLRDGTHGLTRVRGPAGVTDFHTALRGGRPVLLQVRGSGCPGCAAPGLDAAYDGDGNLLQLNGLRLERDPTGRLTRLHDAESGWPGLSLSFDAQGALRSWHTHATGGETRRRDAAGRITERRYANGDVWQYARDGAGRLVEVIARANGAAVRTTIAWRGGRPVRVDHPHQHETRRYDRRGRLAARTVYRPALPDRGAGYGYSERYAWDAQDRLVRHDLPEGGRLRYAYDDAGRIARITWDDGSGTREYELLRVGPGDGYLHANGLHARGLLRHDGLYALVVDDPAHPARPPVFAQRLGHDRGGRVAHDSVRNGDWRIGSAYAYDDDARLAGAAIGFTRPAGATTQGWRYAWRDAGDLRAMERDGVMRSHRAQRDASGLPRQYGGLRLHYGPDRRLTRVMRGSSELVRYAHNAYGERIRRHRGGRAEHYLYTANRLSARALDLADGGVGVVQRYVYAGWVPVAMIAYPRPRRLGARGARPPAPVFYAIHADAAGLPHAVTDARRRIRWRAAWSPTGAPLAVEGDLDMPLRQPGHVADPATGWHDNYVRTYDPRAGHYLEPDPAGPMPDTQAYGYARQQPRRYIDPFGLLLFAFDGTSRDLTGRTNVGLMSGWYADGTAYYHRGPGFASPRFVDAATAGSAPAILGTQWQALLREVSAASGHGRSLSIDLLGYSRGAALAMHFGNMIAGRYRAGRFWHRDPALGTVTACADLRFMGLFDAVAQFGVLGADNAHYDLAVSAEWHWVAHAVALHEHRGLFPLSATPDGAANVSTAPFIGAHGDIGGGYLAEPADVETARPGGDLSDVALAWMLDQARRAGTSFRPPPAPFRRVDNAIVHDERGSRARRRGSDRAVLDGAGATRLARQGQHPDYGDRARAEVEAFIRRVENWTESAGPAVATVDMAAYRGWLRRTLDLDLPH